MPQALLRSGNGIYHAPGLSAFAWLEHGFGTRVTVDWPEPKRLAFLKQIHSAVVIEASQPGLAGDGDALMTNEPGLLVGVRTADCVPVLLADERNRAVAAVHAGWKGTAARIVQRALEEMRARFGTVGQNVHAAIGPCIGSCCYEVGPDVAEQFLEWLPELEAGVRQKLDLVTANRRQLEAAGVPSAAIGSGPPCTFCSAAELHSYRRDGERAGRMMSAIGLV